MTTGATGTTGASAFIRARTRDRPSPETMADFPKVAAKVWEAKQGGSEREVKRLTARLEEQKRLKFELMKMRMRNELSLEDFEQAKADISVETYEIEEQLRAVTPDRATAVSFVRFAELQLVDIANVWGSPHQSSVNGFKICSSMVVWTTRGMKAF